ncbi:MAG: type II secretion system minor pseudopilin GspJ [Gammaproteobacteria bacterium]|nr:type II secretion system minor pseudopilin GspJ [Gammaproteobacteria bacterium]MDH3429057.1 type II secretion system minor pseudopilin GspJ [Gammaproteobacteria bacterium]MDH3433099.1 type II secretion system minor pseudopilin GspJ [Gammaproteobacteria bacterium]
MRQLVVRGFTLIEVLVALAVFGVMSMLAYTALGSTLNNADYLSNRMDRLQSIQRTVRYLSTDLFQVAPRPVRSEVGDSYSPALQSSLGSEFALELTHGGWSNPAGLPRGTLQRVAYRIEDDELVRYHWNVLDRTYANEPVATVLIDDVESLYFRYFDASGEPSDVWPPQAASGPALLRSRPRAVEIVLTLNDQGEIRRLLEIAP